MVEILDEDEWLRFDLVGSKAKTKVISVYSKSSDCYLGNIKWNPGWRHYCFFPTIVFETVYSDRCLKTISEFLTEINEEHASNLKKLKEEDVSLKARKLPSNDTIKNMMRL